MPYSNGEQYNTAFNQSYSIMFNDLTEWLFQKDMIRNNKKFQMVKFCMMRTFLDYATEIVKGFQYSPEMLVELIDMHDEMKTKFEGILKELAAIKEEKKEKVLANIEE